MRLRVRARVAVLDNSRAVAPAISQTRSCNPGSAGDVRSPVTLKGEGPFITGFCYQVYKRGASRASIVPPAKQPEARLDRPPHIIFCVDDGPTNSIVSFVDEPTTHGARLYSGYSFTFLWRPAGQSQRLPHRNRGVPLSNPDLNGYYFPDPCVTLKRRK